jgi:hypothetical protein
MATCEATRKDGTPCRTQVVGDGRFCFAHEPALHEKRTQARRKGGQNRATARRLQKFMPASLVPIYELLEQALTDVLAGDLDPRQANAAANLGRALVVVLEHGELEERIRRLEESA